MKTARQSDAVTWWMMGRTAKAKGYDADKWAEDIKHEAPRRLFLSGANGEPRPTKATLRQQGLTR